LPVFELAQQLGTSDLSVALQSRTWLTATLQAIHIVMIGVVFVSMLLIVLRVQGKFRRDESFETVWQRFAPWMWRGLAIMAATGLLLIIGEPLRQAKALSFWLKMGLLVVAVLCTLCLRRSLAGHVAGDIPSDKRWAARAILVIWLAIIFLGRAIAYDVEVWESFSLGSAQ
jgi:putative copper export protein